MNENCSYQKKRESSSIFRRYFRTTFSKIAKKHVHFVDSLACEQFELFSEKISRRAQKKTQGGTLKFWMPFCINVNCADQCVTECFSSFVARFPPVLFNYEWRTFILNYPCIAFLVSWFGQRKQNWRIYPGFAIAIVPVAVGRFAILLFGRCVRQNGQMGNMKFVSGAHRFRNFGVIERLVAILNI